MTRTRLLSLGVAALGAALALAACGGASESSDSAGPGMTSAGSGGAGGSTVTIEDFAFQPGELTVEAGTKVVWTNRDDTAHTVTGMGSGMAGFDSGDLGQDEIFAMTFNSAGSYAYLCDIHQYMTASIRVT